MGHTRGVGALFLLLCLFCATRAVCARARAARIRGANRMLRDLRCRAGGAGGEKQIHRSWATKTVNKRRSFVSGLNVLGMSTVIGILNDRTDAAEEQDKVAYLEKAAREMYGGQDFKETARVLSELIKTEPDNFRWIAARAEAYVDAKEFTQAVDDYNRALKVQQAYPTGDELTDAGFQGRLLSGRALAYEGLAKWDDAIRDYDRAIDIAIEQKVNPDPYILNSRGNCYASKSDWSMARKDYLSARDAFQKAKGFRGEGGSTTQRLDGAIYAASNAALMLAQLGDEDAAMKEMIAISRRGPGSVDIRAALAAQYWRVGKEDEARAIWQFACESINAGCGKYFDADWVRRIRRWPPVMQDRLETFIKAQRIPSR